VLVAGARSDPGGRGHQALGRQAGALAGQLGQVDREPKRLFRQGDIGAERSVRLDHQVGLVEMAAEPELAELVGLGGVRRRAEDKTKEGEEASGSAGDDLARTNRHPYPTPAAPRACISTPGFGRNIFFPNELYRPHSSRILPPTRNRRSSGLWKTRVADMVKAAKRVARGVEYPVGGDDVWRNRQAAGVFGARMSNRGDVDGAVARGPIW